ncbi:dimethylsulfoxide reductase [Salmonella enterica subsp. enterica serovar Typhimurium]|nr:dimethylsulfoxide reductase [Salmonella enterica subsp. enterica serovar Typhimurium]
MTTQYGFFIDSSRCTGCKTCELACKDYKDLTPDVSFRRIYEYAGGDWQEDNGVWHQNVFAYYLSISCNHCEDPACTKVCPSGAMHKRDDGFVVVNEEVCIGWPIRRRYKMGSGWHEWPLMIFTVFGQCVVGALIVSGLGWLTAKDDTIARQRIVRSMFFLWLVMGLGFLASIMHLGSPMRAFNSLNRVGASALSNEIAAGSVFFAVGGIWWLVAVLGKMPPALGKVWLLVSMALGVAFIWAMTLVYQIDTVPTWYNGYTTLAFFLTAFLCGPVFAALLLRIARVPFCSVTFASISGLALVVCVTVIVLQGLSLSTIHSSVQQASHLAPDYGMLQVWRIVLLAAGLGCWLCPLIRRREPHTVGLLLGVVLVLAGEIIGRGLFYGLHMTVGMAVAG